MVARAVWWVNQGSTYRDFGGRDYLWAPKQDKTHHERKYWNTLEEVKPGDLIVHYGDGVIHSISRATGCAYDCKAPGGPDDEGCDPNGRRVDTESLRLSCPVQVSRQMAKAIRQLVAIDGPITKVGTVKSHYLLRFSEEALRLLSDASSERWPDWAQSADAGVW
jgi:hypothetical protein